MGLAYNIEKAGRMIAGLTPADRKKLDRICNDIRLAQERLEEKAAPVLKRCMTKCQGLCCRNIYPDSIITLWDFVYIRAMAPSLEKQIALCAEKESLFSSDCVFLADGTGPCIFPSHVRPEKCVISFCSVEPSISREIHDVRSGFNRLIWFFYLKPILSIPAHFKKRTGR